MTSQGSTVLDDSTVFLQDVDIFPHEAVYNQETKLEEVKSKYDDVENQGRQGRKEASRPRWGARYKFYAQ